MRPIQPASTEEIARPAAATTNQATTLAILSQPYQTAFTGWLQQYRPSDYENYVRLASEIAPHFGQIKHLPRFRRRLVAPIHGQEIAGGTLKTVPVLNFRETRPEWRTPLTHWISGVFFGFGGRI